MSYPFISGDPTLVNDALPQAKPGGLYYTAKDGGLSLQRKWRYVKSTDALVLGDAVIWDDNADGYTVTRVAANGLVGTPLGNVVRGVGVAQGSISAGQWGYVLVAGVGSAKGDGSVATGNYIVVD